MYEHGGNIYDNIDCIDFSANINFLGMPMEVKIAVKESLDDCEHYPDVKMSKLKSAISNREKLDETNIICGNGAAELIFAVVTALKPKKALIFAPGFYEYEQALSANKCEIMVHNLKEKNDFILTDEEKSEVLEKINDSIDIVFICNPNNPTGNLSDKQFIIEMLKRCKKSRAMLVVDECFMDFVSEREKYSVAELVSTNTNLFVLKAFTKIFAMPGLRLGYGLCSGKELLLKMRQNMQPWNVSVPAQAAGVAAAGLSAFEDETRKKLDIERKYLTDEMKKHGLKIYGCAANYIFFGADEHFAEFMLEKNILVRDCSNYRNLQKGFYRIAVRSHEENMKFVDALM